MRRGLFVGITILLVSAWTAAELGAQTTTTTGTAQELGPFTYYNFQSSGAQARHFRSSSTTGTSQELGPFTHYNFTTNGSEAGHPRNRTTTGTSQRLGAFTTFDFRSSDGSSTRGSIWDLGTASSWSLSTDEPADSSDPFGSIWEDD
jgi:hypothetical protein